ncbi:PGM2 [Scenedesmus sp. PABB004]|nr:PGM2 [Scenedesmus sp. PABB004]
MAAPDVAAKTAEWLALDAELGSRAAVQALLDARDDAALEELMCRRLEFGTAGLRAKMGPGFNRMNAVTVQQTTQGLLRYLQAQAPDALAQGGVIIGFDARHNSRAFAHLAAAVFASAGVRVALPGDYVPTPVVAAGVSLLGCAAGVMVTASHNTKEYNGYKVYWGNGCQIIPPHDAGIAACIEANQALWELPAELPPGLTFDPTQRIAEHYYAALSDHLRFCSDADNAAAARAVYTPLHGVGGKWALRAFKTFGLPEPLVVAAQAAPDPEFPTVVFPNPEEGEGTWQMAFDTATEHGAALVLANDPDADRLAAAEQALDGAGRGTGRFTTFSGNDIGLLLADWVWTNFRQRHPEVAPSGCLMLASAVSSAALGAMAAAEGFGFEQTLTGFKWLGNVAQARRAEGRTVLFAFEEAIGFMFPATNMDKDGVSAAAVFAEMAASHYRRGTTVAGHLAALYDRYGVHVSRASYYVADPPSKSQPVFDRLRRDGRYPEAVGGVKVTGVRDLGTGLDTTRPDREAALPWTAGDMMLTLYFDAGVLTLRASATEPKLKYYLEVRGADRAAAEALADALAAAVTAELVRPGETGLAATMLLLRGPPARVCSGGAAAPAPLRAPRQAAALAPRGRRSLLRVLGGSGAAAGAGAPAPAKAGKPKKGAPAAGVAVAGAGAGAAVSTAAPRQQQQQTPAAAPLPLANPPLGFSGSPPLGFGAGVANNIVPAAPLAAPREPDCFSSDEELDAPRGAPGAGRSSAYRCLVLDSRYLPVNVVSWFRAVVMDEGGKVDVLEYHASGYAYSAYKAHPLPAVLRVRAFVDVHDFAGRLSLTRKNVMLRDHHRCQYCGSDRELTLDHVVPVCRGGANSWTNLVTACMACNQRKGNKSLAQLGWSLPSLPREPSPQEVGVLAGISKSDLESPPPLWEPYLATFRAVLDKAQRRAAAAAAAGRAGAALASSGGLARDGDDGGLVSVTLHPAGPGSKAAKAAAAGGGGVKAARLRR